MTVSEKFLNEMWKKSLNALEKKLKTVVQYKLLCPKCNKEEIGEKVQEKPVGETYTLKIPRPQYDRISDAFNLRETYFESFDIDSDTITFKINETQRLNFIKNYYITQMFLEENIGKYIV